jgi:hypothetical protein
MEGLLADPRVAPREPGERIWEGQLEAEEGSAGYRLLGSPGPDGEPWRLITLEPALQEWLSGLRNGAPLRLVGCANPWGPWLRVSRLVD